MQQPDIDANLFKYLILGVKDQAIFALDPSGTVVTWNAGAARIKGYSADEIIGTDFSIFYTQEAKEKNRPAFALSQALKNGSYEEEGWRVRKDGRQIWASVTISSVLAADGSLAGFMAFTRDFTERKYNEAALERARDEAVVANQMKSKFVANVTHEIRTPLGGIVGLSQLIADDKEATADVRDSGKRIFEASKQLLAIVNDLLDFAKLEAGKVEVEKIPYSIAAVVDEVRGLSKRSADSKSLAFTVTIDSALAEPVVGDPNRIRQILLNLVGNAIKFTESGGLNISVEIQGGALLFSVTDTGVGVSEEIQSKLFKPFVQAHESTARLFGGTGIGLSIAEQLVELMGGAIGMVSEPGRGTTVWFSLPLQPHDGGTH